jgi:Urease beta subunit
VQDPSLYSREKLPGAIIARKEDIIINKGRERVRLRVTNTGDRPVQVGINSTIEMRKYQQMCTDWLSLPLHRD